MADDLYHRSTHFIGGELVPAHAEARIDLIDPATEEVFGQTPDGDAADVDAAVQAASAALPAWSALTPRERSDHLRALADAFEKRLDQVSELVSTENGTPIGLAKAMQTMVPANYRYFAGLADEFTPEEVRTTMTGDAVIVREPVGVVGAIVPWNGPQPLTAWKVGPALAAGCTAVIKPAAETGLDAYLLAEAVVEAGLPPGVLNIVTGGPGDRCRTGQASANRQDRVHRLHRGRAGHRRAVCPRFQARHPRTGGKSAGILLDDVDLEAFKPFVMSACTPNTGQTCRALTRILAPRSRYEEVTEFIADTMKNIPLGARVSTGTRSIGARSRSR